MTKISIIIPVYNTEKYLKECIDSILSQNFEDVEIICINDGSTDGSLEILKSYSQKIKLVNKENSGAGDSRNIGLNLASGEWILFLDSDDFLEENALAKLYNKAKSDDTEVIFFNVNKFLNEDNEKIFYNFVEPYFRRFGEQVFFPCDAVDIIFQTNAHPFKMYKRESLKKYDCKYSTNSLVEDQSLFYSVISNFDKICVLNDAILNYRIHDESITTKISKYISDLFAEFYLCEDIIKKSKYSKLLLNEFIKHRIHANFYWFEKISKDRKDFYYKNLREFLKYIQKEYGNEIFEDVFEKKEINKILKYSYKTYAIIDKIFTTYKVIATYLN